MFPLRALCVLVVFILCTQFHKITSAQQLDPAAWGSDHVGKALPNFTSGDECLFCHRDVGPGWPNNRHGQTIRTADANSPLPKSFAVEIEFILGRKNNERYLKRSADHGRL